MKLQLISAACLLPLYHTLITPENEDFGRPHDQDNESYVTVEGEVSDGTKESFASFSLLAT